VKAGFLGGGYFSGGVMVWGLGPNGEKLAAAFPDDNVVKNINLAQGDWSFYAVGWYSGNALESSVKCGVSETTLQGQASNVSITMTDSDCTNTNFAPGAYRTGNSFNPLKFIICDDITSKTQGQNCDGAATKGSAASFKVKFNENSPDGSLSESMSSSCLNETSTSLSSTSTIFVVPVGQSTIDLFDFTIETYSQSNCLGNQIDFNFDSSIFNGSGNNLLYSSGSETEIFLEVPLIAPAISSYTSSSADYPYNTAITTNSPLNIGGEVTAYTVAPALPAGLALNATTGDITGTPTTSTVSSNYTITATGPGGSDTFVLTLSVLDEAPIFSGYTSNDDSYIVGLTIASNVPTLSTGVATSYSISPSLPAGLSFNTSTGAISGTPTAASADQVYTITASNNGGTDSITINIEVLNPAFLSFDVGASYDFGVLPVGGQQNQTITITNTGGYVATGTNEVGLAAPFSFSGGSYPGTGGSCGVNIPAAGNCTIEISFSPVGVSTPTDTLDLQYNNGASVTNSTIAISGTAVTPASLTISDSNPYDFGTVATGGSSTHIFTVTNIGVFTASSISEIGLATPFNFTGGVFPGTSGTCTSSLTGGNSCNIDIEYSPTVTGLSSDTIVIDYNNGVSTQTSTRSVQGTGANPALLSIDVGASFDFGIIPALPTQPTSNLGSWNANTNTPTLINGTGTVGDYYTNTTAGAVNFGDGAINFAVADIALYDGTKWHRVAPLATTTFTVSNTGGYNASSIALSGLSSPFYDTGSGTCGTNLAAAGTCTIILKATPLQVASYSSTLSVGYFNGASTTSSTVSLSAKGGTIIDLAASTNSKCAVFNNGKVKCWGANTNGELGLEINASSSKGDQTAEMGANLPFVDLGTNFRAAQISGGGNFFCARSVAGNVKCWGNNSVGQLGQGDTISRGINSGDMGDNLLNIDLGVGRTAKKNRNWRSVSLRHFR